MADWYVSSAAWTAIPQFAVSGVYSLGQFVRPLTAPAFTAQFAFRCTTAGTASTEPAWPAANNATVTTGGATFTNVSGQSTYGWSAPAGNLLSITPSGSGRFTAGDRAFLSSDHVESASTNSSYALVPGASYGVIQVISVNRAGSVPPVAADALSGAAITYTGSSNLIIDCACNLYWQGVTFTAGGTATAVYLANFGVKSHYFKNCAFVLSTSNAGANIGTNIVCQVTLDNTTVQFGNVGQYLRPIATVPAGFTWINTPSALLGSVPGNLFAGANSAIGLATLRGVDLSALTTNVYFGGSNGFQKVLLDSCRIAPGLVRTVGSGGYVTAADEIELVNCYDGTHFVSERHTPAGDVTTEFSTTLVGGAADNVGLFSHKMISSARSDPYTMLLEGFWMDTNLTTVGSARTATVEIVSSVSLNNNDISLLVEYEGTTTSSLASFVTTLNPLAAVAAVTSSPATWNNPPATPVMQHLQVTFTPRTAGRVRAQVRLGKVSTTVWVNPQVVIT